jgi:environmental stress-induced protein Ves
VRVIPSSTWRSQPWKNGGGVTHEILRAPDRDDFDLRISLAEVAAPGPFSRFPGYRRWSFLVGSAPIVLTERGGVRTELVTPGDHVELPGDIDLDAALPAGPTHLLNILARTGDAVVVGHGPVAHPVRFAFTLAPSPQLPRWSAVIFDPPAPLPDHAAIWLA